MVLSFLFFFGCSYYKPRRKKFSKLRDAIWNVGSMTSRSNELAQKLRKRKNEYCVRAETKWIGNKSKEIGDGYKILYPEKRVEEMELV